MHDPAGPGLLVVRVGPLATDVGPWRDRVAAEVARLQHAGWQVVVVHRGGARVDALTARLGERPAYNYGKPAPDEAMFAAAEMAASAVGKELAAAIQQHGARAIGLSGRDAGILQGEGVAADGLRALLADGFVVVLASLARGPRGDGLLRHPDDAAADLAGALRADELLLLGLHDGLEVHGQRARALGSQRARIVLSQAGVAPEAAQELAACIRAVEAGAKRARVADVRIPGALAAVLEPAPLPGTVVRAEGALEALRAALA
jgi:acetylglutamate kinase